MNAVERPCSAKVANFCSFLMPARNMDMFLVDLCTSRFNILHFFFQRSAIQSNPGIPERAALIKFQRKNHNKQFHSFITTMTITNQSAAMDPLNPLVNAMGQMNLGVRTTSSDIQPGLAEGGFPDSPTKPVKQDNERDDELDEVEEEMTYEAYRPAKLLYGKEHPDPVVENSTLAAVLPPDITYNLAIPANVIIAEGKLSNLQLEAIVYGNQRHAEDLPVATTKDVGVEGAAGDRNVLAKRCGFLLGGEYIPEIFSTLLFASTHLTSISFFFRLCRDGKR